VLAGLVFCFAGTIDVPFLFQEKKKHKERKKLDSSEQFLFFSIVIFFFLLFETIKLLSLSLFFFVFPSGPLEPKEQLRKVVESNGGSVEATVSEKARRLQFLGFFFCLWLIFFCHSQGHPRDFIGRNGICLGFFLQDAVFPRV
jgi:hypothetical protein